MSWRAQTALLAAVWVGLIVVAGRVSVKAWETVEVGRLLEAAARGPVE